MHPLKPDMETKLYVTLESHNAESQDPTVFRVLYILLKWVREHTIIRVRFPSQKTLLNFSETSDRYTLLTGPEVKAIVGGSFPVERDRAVAWCLLSAHSHVRHSLGIYRNVWSEGEKSCKNWNSWVCKGLLTARETWVLMLCWHLT